MTEFTKADRVINKLVKSGKRKFILFPYGEWGSMVERNLVERYGIKDSIIIDNGLAEVSEKVHKIDYLKEIDWSNYTVLLTSENESIYAEIRTQILDYVDMEHIVDVLSYSPYFDNAVNLTRYIGDLPMAYLAHDFGRLDMLAAATNEIYLNGISGMVAECGVYKGDFACILARIFPDRKLYLFDTFSGFDKRDINKEEEIFSGEFRKHENFQDNLEDIALNRIPYKQRVIVKKGYFPETTKGLTKEKFCMVSLDTDMYKPIKAGLEFFYPRMCEGGYIIVHDFVLGELKGVREAVVEYCKEMRVSYLPVPRSGAIIIQKPIGDKK